MRHRSPYTSRNPSKNENQGDLINIGDILVECFTKGTRHPSLIINVSKSELNPTFYAPEAELTRHTTESQRN